MDLTRRDALAALAAAGAAGAAGAGAATLLDDGTDEGLPAHDRETLVAVAEVVYPAAVSGVPAFVERYAAGRTADRPDYRAGVHRAVAALDAYARTWEDAAFAALDAGVRDDLLRGMGVADADPDPGGEPRERVRYYLVNDLLFALYSTPTGSRLVGLENPPGHAGGRTHHEPPADAGEGGDTRDGDGSRAGSRPDDGDRNRTGDRPRDGGTDDA